MTVDALAGQASDSNACEELVGNLLRPLESVEANPKGQQLELAGCKRRSPFAPDHAIARSHVPIVGGIVRRRIGWAPQRACGKAATARASERGVEATPPPNKEPPRHR